MANEEQLSLLQQGVDIWNQWRLDNSNIQPDLSGASLNGMDLSGADLKAANLIGAVLSEADLRRANLQQADLSGADLFKVDLFEANLNRADLRGADLIRANLIEANLLEANLTEADFSWADLIRINLRRANLSRANLIEAHLNQADLSGAYLSRANLFGSSLIGANLNGANLGGANLIGADFSQADLSRADLIGADLTRANLSRADLSRADLSEAWLGLTMFGDVDLQEVRGLETIKHFSRSYVDIHTIYRSDGKISRVFLRGMGVPDKFIGDMEVVTAHALDYQPCFISYATQDEPFAERLYADLQLEGVHCWFSPEELKIRPDGSLNINETLRRHDKLLLVLSKHSITSRWIEQEVESTLAREHKDQETILYPIRLDDMILEPDGGWPALLRNTRPISNFHAWQNMAAYDQLFQKLLADLRIRS
jgi:uncharacterized protein YjbI with pentapeptide repeats